MVQESFRRAISADRATDTELGTFELTGRADLQVLVAKHTPPASLTTLVLQQKTGIPGDPTIAWFGRHGSQTLRRRKATKRRLQGKRLLQLSPCRGVLVAESRHGFDLALRAGGLDQPGWIGKRARQRTFPP